MVTLERAGYVGQKADASWRAAGKSDHSPIPFYLDGQYLNKGKLASSDNSCCLLLPYLDHHSDHHRREKKEELPSPKRDQQEREKKRRKKRKSLIVVETRSKDCYESRSSPVTK